MSNVLNIVKETLEKGGKVYQGFALSSAMFSGNCTIKRTEVTVDEMAEIVKLQDSENYFSCLNMSHKATLDVLKTRFDIEVKLPEEAAPRVIAKTGDIILVLGVVGLPRLIDRHEYTEEEIANAKFSFVVYQVM